MSSSSQAGVGALGTLPGTLAFVGGAGSDSNGAANTESLSAGGIPNTLAHTGSELTTLLALGLFLIVVGVAIAIITREVDPIPQRLSVQT